MGGRARREVRPCHPRRADQSAKARRHDQDRPARLAERHARRHRHAGPRRLSAARRQSGARPRDADACDQCRADRPRHRAFRAVEPRVHLDRHRQPDREPDPGEARARFNIRFNDTRTRAELREEVERRVAQAAGNSIRWHIDWEPSNSDVFLTTPGPFVAMVSRAITEVTGLTPKLSTTGGTSDARFIKDYCPVIEFGLVEPADAQDRRARRDRRPGGADRDLPAHSREILQRMIPKKPAPHLMRGGNRFSDEGAWS